MSNLPQILHTNLQLLAWARVHITNFTDFTHLKCDRLGIFFHKDGMWGIENKAWYCTSGSHEYVTVCKHIVSSTPLDIHRSIWTNAMTKKPIIPDSITIPTGSTHVSDSVGPLVERTWYQYIDDELWTYSVSKERWVRSVLHGNEVANSHIHPIPKEIVYNNQLAQLKSAMAKIQKDLDALIANPPKEEPWQPSKELLPQSQQQLDRYKKLLQFRDEHGGIGPYTVRSDLAHVGVSVGQSIEGITFKYDAAIKLSKLFHSGLF